MKASNDTPSSKPSAPRRDETPAPRKPRPRVEQADGSPGESGAIANPMPGLSPQNTPGMDRWSDNDCEAVWRRATREL